MSRHWQIISRSEQVFKRIEADALDIGAGGTLEFYSDEAPSIGPFYAVSPEAWISVALESEEPEKPSK